MYASSYLLPSCLEQRHMCARYIPCACACLFVCVCVWARHACSHLHSCTPCLYMCVRIGIDVLLKVCMYASYIPDRRDTHLPGTYYVCTPQCCTYARAPCLHRPNLLRCSKDRRVHTHTFVSVHTFVFTCTMPAQTQSLFVLIQSTAVDVHTHSFSYTLYVGIHMHHVHMHHVCMHMRYTCTVQNLLC
jgi:hypothetical protein